jgi:hypothetical protein
MAQRREEHVAARAYTSTLLRVFFAAGINEHAGGAALEHDPEKWAPVFGKDHALPKGESKMTIRRKIIRLLFARFRSPA